MPTSYTVSVILGLGVLVWYLKRREKQQAMNGLGGKIRSPVGRSISVTHPLHPYGNGVPAVWGGRQIRY